MAPSLLNINGTQTPFATYTALPTLESGVPLVNIPLNAEDDDALHRPVSGEDDEGVCATDGCLELCSPRALLNVGGLVLMTLVVVGVFVGVPIVAFLQRAAAET